MSESVSGTYARLAAAQKGHARGAPAYSVYVNRRLGRWIAALAYRWRWTPNHATAVSALHTFAGMVVLLIAPRAGWTGLLVTALLLLGYAWDSADGQLARLRGGGTPAGEWLDHFVDAIKMASLHLVVAVALWTKAEPADARWFLLPLGYSVVSVVTFFGMLLNDLLKGKAGVASTHQRGGGTAARSLLLLPTDFGSLCLVFLLWGWTGPFLGLYAVMFALGSAFLVAAALKWYREIASLGGHK